MTESKAIMKFKERLAIDDYKEQIPEYYEAMELAIKALEKQIPKKVIFVHPLQENDGGDYMCPSCKTGTVLNAYGHISDYCPYCGQKLESEV